MKKKIITNKKKYTSNMYPFGGDFGDPTKIEGALTGAAGSVLNTLGSNIIGGGLTDNTGGKIGSGISTLGSTVGGAISAVNPLIGGIVSAASGVLGGLATKAFGADFNEANINNIESQNRAMANTIVAGGSNDNILNQWKTQEFGDFFTKGDIGKDGWFSNSVSRKYNKLKREQQLARNRVLASYDNAIEGTEQSLLLNDLANYSALGGPLNTFKSGGNIYIKPSKRGTFTAAAKKHGKSVQAFANQVLANKEDYSPAMVKKANFAKNASKWHHAFGGNLSTNGTEWDNGITIIGNGNTHEENPHGGVQIGVDQNGVPNLVEEKEVIFNDYVFSNRLKVSEEVKQNLKLKGKDLTFAEAAKQAQKESEERPNDPISKRGLEDSMYKLQQAQENMRDNKRDNNYFEDGGWMEKLRYAPALGSITGVLQNIFSKPDYSNADAMLHAAEKAGTYTPVGFKPIGTYLRYNPLDRNYYTNKLDAQAGASRRAIINTSSPSRNAALLAADYNAQDKLGDLARQAEEYNLAQKQQVAQFNRDTDMANSELGLKAAMANQDAALKAGNIRLGGIAQALAMRNAIDDARSASLSSNISGLFTNLGNIGIDTANRADRKLYINAMSANLPMDEYRRTHTLAETIEEAKRRGFTEAEIEKMGFKKYGGYIKRKKGGLTY